MEPLEVLGGWCEQRGSKASKGEKKMQWKLKQLDPGDTELCNVNGKT